MNIDKKATSELILTCCGAFEKPMRLGCHNDCHFLFPSPPLVKLVGHTFCRSHRSIRKWRQKKLRSSKKPESCYSNCIFAYPSKQFFISCFCHEVLQSFHSKFRWFHLLSDIVKKHSTKTNCSPSLVWIFLRSDAN